MNLEQAEAAFLDAKEAYRADKSETNRVAFHTARDVLVEARRAFRADRVGVSVVAEEN